MIKEISKELDIIVNASAEDLVKEFNKVNLGELTNFINKLTLIYSLQEASKNEILELIKEGEKTPEESEVALKGLYLSMQKIEDTVTVLKNLKKTRISSLTQ